MNSNPSEKLFTFEQNDLLIESMPILQDLRKKGLFCDVVIKAGDREFLVHRHILAATIPYFYTMFTSDYKESKQKEILIQNIDPSELEALINFSYSGKIQIDPESVQKLMSAADFVQLIKVKNACADYLKSNIRADNVFGIKKLANLLRCQQLVSAADEFINYKFSEIAESNEFLTFNLEEIKELIGKDSLNCSEEIIFEAAVKWVKHKDGERISHLPEILSKVQLSLVSTEYLVNVVSTEKLIRSSVECFDILDKAKTYHLMQCDNKLAQRNRNWFKLSNFVPTIVENQLKIYDGFKNEWVIDDNLNRNVSGSTIISLGSKIYVIGGKGIYAHNMDIYDFKTKKWSKGENMITERFDFGVTTLYDCIYVCGGLQASNFLSSVDCYSIKENSWKEVAPMKIKRYFLGVISLNGYIYAIGGINNNRLNSCEKYDPTSNTWISIKPLLCKRDEPGVVSFNNKIYVCGGYDDGCALNSCEVYDPCTDMWSLIAPMNKERYGHSMIVMNGKLYAVENYSDVPLVEVYYPETNSWQLLYHI